MVAELAEVARAEIETICVILQSSSSAALTKRMTSHASGEISFVAGPDEIGFSGF
jgi:hypothetical protein